MTAPGPRPDAAPAHAVSRRAVLAAGATVSAWWLGGAVARDRATAAVVDPFAAVRAGWRGTLVAPYDPTDAVITGYVRAAAASALAQWNALDRAADRTRLWPDLDPVGDAADLHATSARLRLLALAAATPGTTLSDHPALTADVVDAVDWLLAHAYGVTDESGGWWYWEVGVPAALMDVAIVLPDALGPTRIATLVAAVARYAPDPTRTGGVASTGANRTWAVAVAVVRGALAADASVLDAARTAVGTAFGYATAAADGFHADGGYLQHTGVPYNGGYGVNELQSLTHTALALRGTRWAFTSSQLLRMYDWTQNGLRPWVYRGAFMDMVRGRALSRFYETDHDAGRVLSAVFVQFAALLSATKAKVLRSQAKGWIRGDTVRPFFTYDDVITEPLRTAAVVAARAATKDPAVTAGGEPTASVVATSTGRVVHRRPLFAYGIAMDSRTVKPYETQSGEDVQGWYTGEGTGYLYLKSQAAHWTDSYWPTVDRYRLPGTTVDTRRLADGVGRKSVNTWTGGAVVDGLVAAGCRIATAYQTLRAQKSWFCLDDTVVCLGAGITSTGGNPVETVVENRNLGENGTAGWTVDGGPVQDAVGGPATVCTPRWAYLDGVGGYVFGPGTDARVLREDRSGRWTELDVRGVRDDTTLRTRRFATLWLPHGADPVDATYSYVLLPGASRDQTSAFAESDDVVVAANTPTLQAVTRARDGVTMLNAWAAGTPVTGGVQVDRAASVVVTRRGGLVTIAVSDPTQATTGPVVVTLDGPAGAVVSADAGVAVLASSPQLQVAVDVTGAAGRTFVARFAAA